MQFEIIMQKLTQISILLVSGLFYIFTQLDVSIFTKAFDQLFSLGLLCVLTYLLYKEWKNSQEYNEERDKRFEELVRNNTEAMNNFRDEIKLIHNRIDENERMIERNG